MLVTIDHIPGAEIELGELLAVTNVTAANVVRDIQENIRNLVGGRMGHYERLIQGAVQSAFLRIDEEAKAQGYDGVLGVKISHPVVVEGAVEVVVYGNGFRFKVSSQ